MKISIIGAGSWGTALALAAHNAGNDVVLWSKNIDVCTSINEHNENKIYLQGVPLSPEIKATANLQEVADKEIILLVVPSQTLRENCAKLAKLNISADAILVICCKGIEKKSLKLMSEVAQEFFPHNLITVLSGPNFAGEVASGLPACATIACEYKPVVKKVIETLSSKFFRLYSSNDIIGAQIAGATKNVLAIACGITAGMNMGENAKAAIITRGIREINRLSLAMGAKSETLLGLSGVGDIMLTCNSLQSRNMSFGYNMGKSYIQNKPFENDGKLVEGVHSVKSVNRLASKLKVEMPIAKAVNDVIYNDLDLNDAIMALLSRSLKEE